MDFDLPPDLVLLRDTVRRFVDEQLIPAEMEDASGTATAGRFEALQRQVRDMGLWQFDVPEALGGPGLGLVEVCVIEEQIARSKAFPTRIGQLCGPRVPSPLLAANAGQRARILEPVLDGRLALEIAASGLGETTDASRSSTTATLDDRGYVVQGVETYLSTGPAPDRILVFARSADGPVCLVVDARAAGVDVSQGAPALMGGHLWTVRLQEARVPLADRLGEAGDGADLARRWVVGDRIRTYGARSIGIAVRALEMMASYAQDRVTFGRPLSRRHVIRMMIADSMTELEMARLLLYQAASRFDRGEDVDGLSSMVKIAATETATRVVDRAMQVHGGTGLTTELPLEHWFRQLRGARVSGGASDALRSSLAGRLVGSA